MFTAREWPGRGINENIRAMFHRQGAAHLRKSKIVANREAEIELVDLATHECVAGSKDGALIQWRGCHQMGLAIFGADVATDINESLRVINARTVTIRNADDDRKRKLLCYFLKRGVGAYITGSYVLTYSRSRIDG